MLAKTKLNTIEITVSGALLDLYISLDKFVSVSNLLREYNDMNEEIKNQKSHQRFIYIYIYIYMYIYIMYNVVLLFESQEKHLKKKPKSCKGKSRKADYYIKCVVCDNKKLRIIKEQEVN